MGGEFRHLYQVFFFITDSVLNDKIYNLWSDRKSTFEISTMKPGLAFNLGRYLTFFSVIHGPILSIYTFFLSFGVWGCDSTSSKKLPKSSKLLSLS